MIIGALGILSGCASTASNIDKSSNQALQVFKEQVNGADVFLNQAAGYLVFPRVIKAGVGIGGESGGGRKRLRRIESVEQRRSGRR